MCHVHLLEVVVAVEIAVAVVAVAVEIEVAVAVVAVDVSQSRLSRCRPQCAIAAFPGFAFRVVNTSGTMIAVITPSTKSASIYASVCACWTIW
jgi:hypothetical protein